MSRISDAGGYERPGSHLPRQTGGSRILGTIYDDAAQIQIGAATLDEILEFSEQDASRELGGFLFGDAATTGRPCVAIRHFLPAIEVRSWAARLTFTHDTWAAIHREAESQFPHERMLGWYHTHPNLGVFLSARDRFIHRHFFHEPWHVALVVDPRRCEFGFFQWRGADLVDCGFVCLQPCDGDSAKPGRFRIAYAGP
jgi:proteasome lid subunit RPN8/RPN11